MGGIFWVTPQILDVFELERNENDFPWPLWRVGPLYKSVGFPGQRLACETETCGKYKSLQSEPPNILPDFIRAVDWKLEDVGGVSPKAELRGATSYHLPNSPWPTKRHHHLQKTHDMKTPLFWLPKNTPYNNTLRKDGASNDGEEREVGSRRIRVHHQHHPWWIFQGRR